MTYLHPSLNAILWLWVDIESNFRNKEKKRGILLPISQDKENVKFSWNGSYFYKVDDWIFWTTLNKKSRVLFLNMRPKNIRATVFLVIRIMFWLILRLKMLVTGLLKSFYILCGTLSAVKYEKRMRKGAMLLIFLKKIEETSSSSTHNHRCLHRFPGSNFVSNCSILLFSLQMRYKGRPPLGTGSRWKWRPRQAQILEDYEESPLLACCCFPEK